MTLCLSRPDPAPASKSLSFAGAIETTGADVVCHVAVGDRAAARDYLALVGRDDAEMRIHDGSLRWRDLVDRDDSVVPLFVVAATEPTLRSQFFGRRDLRFFVDQIYRPEPDHESPRLFVIGTTEAAWRSLGLVDGTRADDGRRRHRLNELYGTDHLHPSDIEQALASPLIDRIRIHALGPDGTNIARAARRYATALGITSRTDVVVHPRKVEPLDYAALAAADRRDGLFPLHAECAVYYDLDRLFDTRRSELVFATHFLMALDGMQLAAREPSPPASGRLASHPSPRSLAEPWVAAGATMVKASSNADAALMVEAGDADLCVTTATAARNAGLHTIEDYGSPMMLFTFGTPLTGSDVRRVLAS